jgi:hypothetical protein
VLILQLQVPEEAKEASGEEVLHLIQIRLTDAEFGKISPARQENLPRAQVADSSSTNAVSFSPTRTTMRLLRACQLAVFSGKLPSMEAEIDDKLPSNSS